jgi:toxin ParE1/3/4
MHEIIFHRLASRELRAAGEWYRARSEATRGRFRQAILEALDRIDRDPVMPPTIVGGYRRVKLRQFPFLLIYELRPDDRILVVAVAHTSRRPGYWRRRT